jgi:hypothetical protein
MSKTKLSTKRRHYTLATKPRSNFRPGLPRFRFNARGYLFFIPTYLFFIPSLSRDLRSDQRSLDKLGMKGNLSGHIFR